MIKRYLERFMLWRNGVCKRCGNKPKSEYSSDYWEDNKIKCEEEKW